MKQIFAVAVVALLASCAGTTGQQSSGVERMYVIECGTNSTTDLSLWSPGFNQNRAMEFSNNCYLIKHAKGGWFLWDTGNSDALAAKPEGITVLNGRLNIRMAKPLLASLKEIGVVPADIKHLAMSHLHADHSGNANYFMAATLYMQEIEYNAAFGSEPQKFGFMVATYERLRKSTAVKLKGDHDVFGDGSIVIKAAPGHTVGHQVLMVRLPKTGPVVLSGDLVHFQENWEAKRVPGMNFNRDQSAQSMQMVDAYVKQVGGTLWINHDKAQTSKIRRAPAYVE